jgi:UDP-N-acetylmuramate dehydrogenase
LLSDTDLQITENAPLAQFTTLGVGGPARYFADCSTEEHVIQALRWAAARSIKHFIIGGGSNLLVADRGFDGLVIRISLKGVESLTVDDGHIVISAAAGEDWDPLVERSVNMDCAGIECLSGIPGSVGGTPVQNVGAYGQEVSQTIETVRVLDLGSMSVATLPNSECGFSYRRSIFNSVLKYRYVVLRVNFKLRSGGGPNLSYRELADRFADSKPTLKQVREAVLEIRRGKSMVIDKGDPNSRSAGSFFKNPIISTVHYERLRAQAGRDIPNFAAGEGFVKVPAAWLLENAGFPKGTVMGNAGTSRNHALALINRGGATAAEIILLKNAITEAVHTRFGIKLVPEPVFLGFDA